MVFNTSLGYSLSLIVGLTLLLTSGIHTQAGNTSKTLRIIYTTDTLGYTEPCGCGGRYEGGFARRATEIARLVKENPNTVIVESGNLTNDASNECMVTELLSGMKYDAVGVGKGDLECGEEFFKQTDKNRLLVIDALRAKSSYVLPYIVKQVNGLRVGIVSYGQNNANISTIESRKTFYSAYKSARDESDILILLDQGGIATKDWLEGIGARLGTPEVVIGRAPDTGESDEKTIGKTLIAATSKLGRKIGVIDVSVASDHKLSLSTKTITIDRKITENDAIAKRISDFLRGSSMRITNTSETPKSEAATDNSPETCKGCHQEIYEDWSKTKHATALKTLVDRDRLVPECLPCHSEEYRQTLKVTKPKSDDDRVGVECATCHASVLPHDENGPPSDAVTTVDRKLCLSCHNSDRSPDYDEKNYMPKASHLSLKQ